MTPNSLDPTTIENRKAACATFIEQTKLLTSLASAFIIAPAIVHNILTLAITWPIIAAEVLFILSVLCGYIAMGAIAGSQNEGEYDVTRPAVMNSGRVQFAAYVLGIAFFGYWFLAAYSAT